MIQPRTRLGKGLKNGYSKGPQLQVIVQVPEPQRPASYGSGVALGVAFVTAGFGLVAGRQAMLFVSSGKSSGPKTKKVGNVTVEGLPNLCSVAVGTPSLRVQRTT